MIVKLKRKTSNAASHILCKVRMNNVRRFTIKPRIFVNTPYLLPDKQSLSNINLHTRHPNIRIRLSLRLLACLKAIRGCSGNTQKVTTHVYYVGPFVRLLLLIPPMYYYILFPPFYTEYNTL